MLTHIIQGREKASESDPRGDVLRLLGLQGWHARLLHCRANLTPSAQVKLFLHGAAPSYQDRRNSEAAQQVHRQLGGQYVRGFSCNEISEQGRKIVWLRHPSYDRVSKLTMFSFITQPNMYARGVLFGKMKYELGDHSFVRCPESGLAADLEFKNKGYFSGKDDAVGGYIKDTKTDKNLFELSGQWNAKMYIKNLTVSPPALKSSSTFHHYCPTASHKHQDC